MLSVDCFRLMVRIPALASSGGGCDRGPVAVPPGRRLAFRSALGFGPVVMGNHAYCQLNTLSLLNPNSAFPTGGGGLGFGLRLAFPSGPKDQIMMGPLSWKSSLLPLELYKPFNPWAPLDCETALRQ